MAYEHYWKIRFEEVDNAGLFFFPRVFYALHHGLSDLFDDIGYSFVDLPEHGVGMPVVHTEADYYNPVRYGNTVRIDITADLGESSLGFEGQGFVGETHAFSVAERHVTIDPETFESVPIPEAVRTGLEPYEA